MKRNWIFVIAVVAVFLSAASSMKANGLPVGGTLKDFKLTDVSGQEKSLDKVKGKNGSVIVFLSISCPVANGYTERIIKMANELAAQGVNVIGIYSNINERSADIKKHANEHFKFQTLIDNGNMLAEELGAMSTPASFFLDGKNKLVYKGAIDNDRKGTNVTQDYLRTAIGEFLSGKTIATPETTAIGCTIQRKKS